MCFKDWGSIRLTCFLAAEDANVSHIYAPDFEEVEGAYWFGPGRLSVRPSVRYAFSWLKLQNRLR